MEKEITIGVSARHVHLTKEVYDLLFDEDIVCERNLHQIGEFASQQKVTLRSGDRTIDNVRVLGPFRNYNQVEVSHKDALTLGINPPVRASGDLTGASQITLETKKGSVTIDACILAQRHVHMTLQEANALGVTDHQKVAVRVLGDRSGTMDAYVKISSNAYYEMHIDTDDANAFLLENNAKGTLII